MAIKTFYKSPLTLYVVWHPRNELGLAFGEAIYKAFCRDAESPLMRSLGIPVQFRFVPQDGRNTPIDIPVGESDHNAIILLADDELFEDDNWQPYIENLLEKQKNDPHTRIFPVAMSDYAFSVHNDLSKKQFINLIGFLKEGTDPLAKALTELKSRLLHDLCRMLYHIEQVSEVSEQAIQPPVTLFISHAKIDGEKLAEQFRDYINSQLKLKTFFDVNDIADADDFGEAICENVENSAVVVFLSDKYSTREWCLIEVIVAKRNKSPLVVVNNLENGEKRSFPYLGNVPTIRYKENCFPQIVDLALYQALNNLYFRQKLTKEIDLYELEDKYITYPIQNTPELFTYIDIKRLQKDKPDRKVLVVYPDPALGKEELRILNDIDEQIIFITPSLIHKILKDE
jgi:hypothetical protein